MTKYNVGGWHKQKPDKRDYSTEHPEVQKFFVYKALPLPSKVDLRGVHMPPIVDQGQLGSCTANAAAAIIDYCDHKTHGHFLNPSRLFQYYNTRLIEGTVDEDSGATIRDTIKAIATYGAIPESKRQYEIARFTEKPTDEEYTLGALYKAINYVLIDQPGMTKPDILQAVKLKLSQGYPLEFGANVYKQIQNVSTNGLIKLPGRWESSIGGHAMVIVGYNDKLATGGALLIRNSWGTDWGMEGYGWMPYSYLISEKTGLSDIWCIVSEAWTV
jgi:C1A family cysteine protease